MKECICHFLKWQIHPFTPKGMIRPGYYGYRVFFVGRILANYYGTGGSIYGLFYLTSNYILKYITANTTCIKGLARHSFNDKDCFNFAKEWCFIPDWGKAEWRHVVTALLDGAMQRQPATAWRHAVTACFFMAPFSSDSDYNCMRDSALTQSHTATLPDHTRYSE